MGASGWDYFTPYQPDIGLALKALQREVFAKGQYQTPWDMLKGATDADSVMDMITGSADMKAMLAAMSQEERAQFEEIFKQQREALAGMSMPQKPPRPRSINQLRAQCAENGTHSIIDIDGVSPLREICKAFPMPVSLVRELYGSDQPTREMVEAQKHKRSEDLDRWECWYVIVYKNGKPSEIYFEGVSGD